jgi:osmotically-inducible protein OsmY
MRMSGMFGLAIFIIACAMGCSTTQQTVKHLTPDERPDTTLTAELKKEFASDAVLKRTKVSIVVNNGEVDLTGTVVSEAEKRRADEVAKSFKGVRWVKNEIIVTPGDNL